MPGPNTRERAKVGVRIIGISVVSVVVAQQIPPIQFFEISKFAGYRKGAQDFQNN